MQPNRPILLVFGAAVAVALVLLLLKVRSAPEVELDAAKLAQAEAQYQRTGSSATPIMDRMNRRDRADAPAAGGDPAPRPYESPPAEPTEPPAGVSSFSSAPPPSPDDAVVPVDDAHLAEQMAEANRLYDRGDFLTADEAALEVLARHPNNIRMLRIVVSTSCATDNAARAKEYLARLPPRDQRQMVRRCRNWSVDLDEGLAQ